MFKSAGIPALSLRTWEQDLTPPDLPEPVQGTAGPHYVDYTPKTLPRNQKADKEFLAESLLGPDVRKAGVEAMTYRQNNPGKDADVILPDGVIYGFGTGSTSTRYLENFGEVTPANGRRIRIRPGGGYGAVTLSQNPKNGAPLYDNLGNVRGLGGLAMRRIYGFTFSEIYGNESAFTVSGCEDLGMEYMHDVTFWSILGLDGYATHNIDFTSIVYSKPRVKNGDNVSLDTAKGPISNVTLRNLYLASIFIGSEETWPVNPDTGKPEKPHSDNLQVKGTMARPCTGLKFISSRLDPCYNCAYQLGGNAVAVDFENTISIGADLARELYFDQLTRSVYDSGGASTFQIFNGTGNGSHTSRNVYAHGNMGNAIFANTAADTLTSLTSLESKTGWTKVNVLSEAQIRARSPQPGVDIPDLMTLWSSRA